LVKQPGMAVADMQNFGATGEMSAQYASHFLK
jgi:hypothetical protein